MNELVIITDQKAVTTSLIVAETFEKNHRDVLRAITRLGCSEEFNQRNFAPVGYVDAKGEVRPMYQITRDGFSFLAMGFTGPKAAQFKEAFITQFNAMEQALLEGTGPGKRIDMNYTRTTFAPGGLDVRYNLDLTPFVKALPAVEQVRVVEQLTGLKLHGIAESLEKKARKRPHTQAPNSFDPVMVAECLEIVSHGGDYPGVVVGEDGSLTGRTLHINNAINSVAASLSRPYHITGFQLGEAFKDGNRKMSTVGWKRTFERTVRGMDIWRYSKNNS